MNYNQYLSVNHVGRYIYSKEIHTLTREITIKRFKEYPFRFFIHDPKSQSVYKNDKGHSLKTISVDSIREFKERVKQFYDYGHKVYGTNKLAYQYIYEDFDKTKFDNKFVKALHFDIETARDVETGYSSADDALNEIISVSAVLNGKIYYWCMKDLPSDFSYEGQKVEVFWFMHESEMISHLLSFIRENADVLTGWNIETYDIPYLINRAKRLELKAETISPFGQVSGKEFRDKFGNTTKGYNIVGVEVLDYLNLYKKFTYVTRDNYRLDTIAQVELGDNKVDYSEYKNLDELYEKDFIKFTEYNIKDSLITSRLENKLKLIDLAITLAYKTGVNFEDTLGTVKIWTFYLYQEMMNSKIVPHMFAEAKSVNDIVGGFVKDPQRGKHKWVMSFDLASLYPHNQMGANISFDKLLEDDELPADVLELKRNILSQVSSIDDCIEKIVQKSLDLSVLKRYSISMTPNIQFYKTDSLGIIPSILKGVYNERKAVKSEMLQRKQELINLKEKYKHWED